MQKKLTAPRIFTGVLLLFLITIAVCALVIPSLGFFQAWFRATGFNSAKVELIFDRLDFTSTNVQNYRDPNDANFRFDSTAEWGTKANPYVISQKYHVQNLSVLQNNGFFKEKKDANDQPLQSYFRVCNKNGTPVAINCEGMTLAPVGTHENPFTGVVEGALVDGEATYTYTPRSSSDTVAQQSYGVSVSTIGNLIVEASVSEPDIGFFGCISYHGTCTIDPTGKNPPTVSNGYAANVQNILLADVTVSSTVTIADQLSTWWAKFKWNVGTTDETEHTHDTYETHHIGVVAGHAEFATVNNISVFYTNGVETYKLAGATNTNYYSTTGLIGLLRYVNPTIQSGGTLVGDGNSVSDGDMVEGGLGGGGTISGTLTGYMLAETLFSEHEKYLTAQNLGKANIYNVKDMKMSNGGQLFETVVMKEGSGNNKNNVTYYYFRDSVFTFAMSASSKTTGTDNADYVMKIWELDEETPSVSATSKVENWEYGASDNPQDAKRAYKLEAVTNIEANNYYVIAYQHSGADGTAGTTDDVLYLVPIKHGNVENNETTCIRIPYSEFVQGTVTLGNGTTASIPGPTYTNGHITSVTVSGIEKIYHDAAFVYKNGRISDPSSDSYGLAVYAKRNNDTSRYTTPPSVITSNDAGSNPTGSSATEGFAFSWTFTFAESGKCAIHQEYSFYGWSWFTNYHRRGAAVFSIDTTSTTSGKLVFDIDDQGDNYRNPEDCPNHEVTADEQIFTIFKLTKNTLDTDGEVVPATGNYEMTPMSMSAVNPVYHYDPSRYVFQSSPSGTYTLAPIASLNLNNGKGKKLEQLNHVVKLFEATKYNYKLTIGSTLDELFGTGIFGDWLNSNSGGVVGAYIGTTNKYYTIPAGMIAFYIDEEVTTPANPSYINMIVAVNPGQTSTGTVGLYQTTESFASDSFNLDNPIDSFTLPCSVVATSNDFRDDYTITVSGRTVATQNADGTTTYTQDTSTSYVYLNGEVAFVYYSFEVTQGGIYLLGSKTGPMSVSYFSVSGAAGQGADGTSTSPLGDIDFVYANGGKIVTVNQKFTGMQDPTDENYALYSPSYHFIVMKGEGTTTKPFVQNEIIKVHRYIDPNDTSGTKRHIKIIGCTNAEAKGLADVYEDDLEE